MLIGSISSNDLTVTRDHIAGYSPISIHEFQDPIYVQQVLTTNGSGDIPEQIIPFRKWEGTAETQTTFSPHKFTLSKAGYETLTLDAVTVSAPINWHLELQRPKAPPRAWGH